MSAPVGISLLYEVLMSCAAVTVNRSLILLAVVWGVIPVAALRVVTMSGAEDTVAHHAVRESQHAQVSLPPPPSEPLPCELETTRGLLPALSLAITQPNRKKAAVTNGR
jgi:hypothetical protein